MLPLLSALVICGAAPEGFHGIAELTNSVPAPAQAAAQTAGPASVVGLAPAWGFKVGDVSLSAGARFIGWFDWYTRDTPTGSRWHYLDPAVVFSAPELLRTADGVFSFTPTLAATVPLSPASRLGNIVSEPLLQLRGDAVFEQFRGSFRFDASRPLYGGVEQPLVCAREPCGVSLREGWSFTPSVIGEFLPWKTVSAGARVALSYRLLEAASVSTSRVGPAPTTEAAAALYGTWRFHPLFGVTAAVESIGHLPFVDGATFVSLSVFARTDEQLEPRWFAP